MKKLFLLIPVFLLLMVSCPSTLDFPRESVKEAHVNELLSSLGRFKLMDKINYLHMTTRARRAFLKEYEEYVLPVDSPISSFTICFDDSFKTMTVNVTYKDGREEEYLQHDDGYWKTSFTGDMLMLYEEGIPDEAIPSRFEVVGQKIIDSDSRIVWIEIRTAKDLKRFKSSLDHDRDNKYSYGEFQYELGNVYTVCDLSYIECIISGLNKKEK